MAPNPLVYINRKLVAETSEAISKATGTALAKNSDALTKGLFRALKKDAIPQHRMFEANLELAELAQAAIRSGWEARLPVNSLSYRGGSNPKKDRLSGALGRALASEAMTSRTTERAISFLDTDTLWEEARHWHRVNYGARGPKRMPRLAGEHRIQIDGHTIATLQDPGKPDPNSWLPRRYYHFGTEYFAPARKGDDGNPADVPGGGHRSALFSELGFQSLSRNLEFVYERMLDDWVREEGAETVRRSLYLQGVRISAHILSGG